MYVYTYVTICSVIFILYTYLEVGIRVCILYTVYYTLYTNNDSYNPEVIGSIDTDNWVTSVTHIAIHLSPTVDI